jgi:hypothetical protein
MLVSLINLKRNILQFVPKEWSNKESVITESIFVNNVKKIKLIKK